MKNVFSLLLAIAMLLVCVCGSAEAATGAIIKVSDIDIVIGADGESQEMDLGDLGLEIAVVTDGGMAVSEAITSGDNVAVKLTEVENDDGLFVMADGISKVLHVGKEEMTALMEQADPTGALRTFMNQSADAEGAPAFDFEGLLAGLMEQASMDFAVDEETEFLSGTAPANGMIFSAPASVLQPVFASFGVQFPEDSVVEVKIMNLEGEDGSNDYNITCSVTAGGETVTARTLMQMTADGSILFNLNVAGQEMVTGALVAEDGAMALNAQINTGDESVGTIDVEGVYGVVAPEGSEEATENILNISASSGDATIVALELDWDDVQKYVSAYLNLMNAMTLRTGFAYETVDNTTHVEFAGLFGMMDFATESNQDVQVEMKLDITNDVALEIPDFTGAATFGMQDFETVFQDEGFMGEIFSVLGNAMTLFQNNPFVSSYLGAFTGMGA